MLTIHLPKIEEKSHQCANRNQNWHREADHNFPAMLVPEAWPVNGDIQADDGHQRTQENSNTGADARGVAAGGCITKYLELSKP